MLCNVWRLGCDWRQDLLPMSHRHWLLDAGSLTQRLRQLTHDSIVFDVRQNDWGQPTEEERLVLQVPGAQEAWLREIDWVHQGELWVKGRVVIPRSSFTDEGERLRTVGERPIGEILFSDQGLKRTDFDLALLDSDHFYHQLACQNVLESFPQLWARRSIFHFYGKPLLVSEIFFPRIFEWE